MPQYTSVLKSKSDIILERDGDYYVLLESICTDYMDELKVFLPDETQNKPQPEPEIEIRTLHPTKTLKKRQLEQLYNELVTGGFIPDSTDKKHFDYVFGGGGKPEDFNPLNCNKILTKQLLRELLTPLKNPDINLEEMGRLVPLYFSKKGSPMNLAKPKHVPSSDSDKISDIIKNLATL